MAVYKRTYKSGKIAWGYFLDRPGSTRETRERIWVAGFPTKGAAIKAEAQARLDAQKEYEVAQASACGVRTELPKTLGELLEEFFIQHADKKLAPKTVERYREQAAYLSADLLAMRLDAITPLHLNREWTRLIERGGHHRKTKAARPLSEKTVRNIAGVISSAFNRAVFWGLVPLNPVKNSEAPSPRSKEGFAFTPQQQSLVIDASTHWALPAILGVAAALGARRGEILALRWSDIIGDRVRIGRSLTQTRKILDFKEPKTAAGFRYVTIPESAVLVFEARREQQRILRDQFGPDYRAEFDLIFCEPDGSPLKPDSISASVSRLFKKLKLPKGVSLHSMRHSHGSHLLAAGMEITAVSKRLGHSNVRVTMEVYAHALSGRDEEAARRWEAFQKANTTSADSIEGKAN
jgi:integrase